MHRRTFLTLLAATGGACLTNRLLSGRDAGPVSAEPAEQAGAIRKAALNFIRSLPPDTHAKAMLAFPKDATPTMAEFPAPRGNFKFTAERFGESMWTNFPVSDVPRPGIRLGDLTAVQRDTVHALLHAALSPMGYQKVQDIMAADQILADEGTPYASGHDAYTIALFGAPHPADPWMLQFGGHHLGLNVIFVGDQAVGAPLHLGILPAKFQAGARTIRALGREHDAAFQLLSTLTTEQRKVAIIDHPIEELVLGPGHPRATLAPQGVLGADLTDAQRTLMYAVAVEWAGVLHDAFASRRLESIRRSMPQTRFAWSGETTHEPGENGAAYFRLHGPDLLIEFAPQGNQGGYKKHIHTVMRDLNNDYARELVT